MLDSFLLFPYWLALKLRHRRYDSGRAKSFKAEVPTICIGNVTVGGTGKTPHTEMVLRMLLNSDEWAMRNLAVLSRGYKRKSKGFHEVRLTDNVSQSGDEPLQIKRKFPLVTVAVDADRVEGCKKLVNPEGDSAPADLIILDDGFQYRKLRADLNIVLVDFNRPASSDLLLPLGRLRDLRERVWDADILVITKCRETLDEQEKEEFAASIGLKDYDWYNCSATTPAGKHIDVFFTCTRYEQCTPVFDISNPRFIYSKKLVLVTGIAGNTAMRDHLSLQYEIVRCFSFPDHHRFTARDFQRIRSVIKHNPTAVILTTEKDAQRIMDCTGVPESVKERMFCLPIRSAFITEVERDNFRRRIVRP